MSGNDGVLWDERGRRRRRGRGSEVNVREMRSE
jgi:hypothetical protein